MSVLNPCILFFSSLEVEMKQVIDGYEITTASTEAAEQTKRGIESFIEWRMDPFDWLDGALETDSDCVFASRQRFAAGDCAL